ncbi:MAG TPA: tetratricopeptide repeat protein [Vicinamibacterales bacterium]|nr:tetratricopeptide repeat protein [Vicinamibacterales bacterium]
MTDSRRARVDALFDEALTLPIDRRSDFLERLSADDAWAATEVEELLRLVAEPGPSGFAPGAVAPGLLQAILALPDVPPTGGLAPGERVGIWRVLREIGRGGMGTVYLVERADGQFEQKGALKLGHSSLGSDDIAQRLRRERRILASLTHANIARLLDGGQTEDGRPFLVMEYIEGRPIDRYCDDARSSVDERVDLFQRVCSGVQHAHARLVVHRDVKPSNIVVTADGEVKLLDFGIARLLSPTDPPDDDALTQPIMRILTPEYASPEQVRGEPVAIASDVYQLGLLLYELLTGQKAQAVASPSPAGLEAAVCTSIPLRPSTRAAAASDEVAVARRVTPRALARKLAGDLDTIILYALRKEPDRRYATVGDLLGDLQRYRAGLPVKAQADSVSYRARKYAGRHRMALSWTAAILVVTAIGLPVLAGQRLRTAREALRAEQVEALLADMLALPNPRILAQPPMAVHYVDHAARLVQSEMAGQPRSQARLLTTVGRLYNALGYYQRSIDVLEEALALRRANFGAESIELAETLEWLGQSHHYLGRYDEAESTVRQALGIRRLRLGSGNPDTLRTALELGDLLHTRGRLHDGEQVLREAVAALRAAALTTRVEDLGHDSLPRALRDLANVLRDRGALEESAALYREAISIFRELHGEPNQQVATSQIYYSRLLIMATRFEAAEAALAQAIPALRRIYDGDHALVGMALREFGYLRTEQGRLDEAEALLSEAQRVQQKWLGRTHPMVPRTRAHQAELARRRGRTSDAVQLARQTLEEFDRLGMSEHPSAIDARATLGEALIALGRHDAAARELERGGSSAERQFVSGDPRRARFREALARAMDR